MELAQELIDAIVDHVTTLKNCSMVSRAFRLSCRRYMFSNLRLGPLEPPSDDADSVVANTCQRFHDLLLTSPDIAALVRDVEIYDDYYDADHHPPSEEVFASGDSQFSFSNSYPIIIAPNPTDAHNPEMHFFVQAADQPVPIFEFNVPFIGVPWVPPPVDYHRVPANPDSCTGWITKEPTLPYVLSTLVNVLLLSINGNGTPWRELPADHRDALYTMIRQPSLRFLEIALWWFDPKDLMPMFQSPASFTHFSFLTNGFSPAVAVPWEPSAGNSFSSMPESDSSGPPADELFPPAQTPLRHLSITLTDSAEPLLNCLRSKTCSISLKHLERLTLPLIDVDDLKFINPILQEASETLKYLDCSPALQSYASPDNIDIAIAVHHARVVRIGIYAVEDIPVWAKVFDAIAGPSNIQEVLIDINVAPEYLNQMRQFLGTEQLGLDRVLMGPKLATGLRRICMTVRGNDSSETGEVRPVAREAIRALFPALFESDIFVLREGKPTQIGPGPE